MSSIKKVHEAISVLNVIRTDAHATNDEYFEALDLSVNTARNILLDPLFEQHISAFKRPTMRFVYGSLFIIRKLSAASGKDTVDSLISIQQQQKIKILLQLVFSLGVLPSLMKGVNVPLAKRTMQLNLNFEEKWSTVEHHNFLTHAVRELLDLLDCSSLRALILIHLGDLLSALLQMIHCGKIKKPSRDETAADNGNSPQTQKSAVKDIVLDSSAAVQAKKTVKNMVEVKKQGAQSCQLKDGVENKAVGNQFVMTQEWYERLTNEREEFIKAYEKLVGGIYKPLVIKELLILLMPCRNKELAAPRWLERAITTQLTGYLISPGGVAMTMRACCPSSSETVEWKKVISMAKLISTVHVNMDPDTFYSLISPQIISLLNTTGTYCLPVAKMCIKRILEQDPERCNKYIFDKLFEPFILCSKPVNEKFTGTLISEESLGRCIDHINKCFTPGSQESALPFEALIKIIKIKFRLYLMVFGSPFQHQLAVQDLLIRFLYAETDTEKLTKLYNALLFDDPHPDMLEMNSELSFQFGPSGGVQVVKLSDKPTPKCPPLISADNELGFECKASSACESMLDLLSQNEMYSKKLLYDLFVVLLSSLLTVIDDDKQTEMTLKTDLLDGADIFFHLLSKKEKKLFTIKLLADLSSNTWVVEGIQKQPALVLKLLIILLERCSEALKAGKYTDDEDNDELTDVVIPLRIVDIMTGDMKPGSYGWEPLKPLIEPLNVLYNGFPLDYVRSMCGIIYERLLTQGAVKTTMPQKNTYRRKPKIQEIPKAKTPREVKKSGHRCKEGLTTIIDLIQDDDIPTRGHGLIELEKKIRKRDVEVIGRKEEVFVLLKQALHEEDSYVYLQAINTLEAMGYINAGMVIELLCEEYMVKMNDLAEVQLKIGEVLVRMTRNLSDLGPTNKNCMINAFLFGAKSTDEFLRASSLSNLAEVLKCFGYSCSPVLQEVFMCARSIALTDKSDMVRRAAVLLAHFLIKGYSCAALVSLQDVMLDLYRVLLQVYKTDADEVVRMHAHAALMEINSLIQDDMFKPKPLEKVISVLGFDH